ncbi:uncharacterized protein [Elaeis guineensis]|uniref:Uncharacterized protein LOC105041067 n=1 Tax=Elaeis guineensis var. tenera TaxID=51953 RepID=A0A6I9QVU6_ELAGV|nr:uncharacterized protein LOC105041067 [Elaeis guineensis]
MSLLISKMAGSGLYTPRHHHLPVPPPRCFSFSPSSSPLSFPSPRRSTHVARARKGLSSRTRRLEKRGKKGATTSTTTKEEEVAEGMASREEASSSAYLEVGGGGPEGFATPSLPMPELPGEEPDFWEGPQWNAFGFFIKYQWAFGIVFALIACGIAVATYNEGATDFRQTPVYKESIQSQELLEEPEASNSDVFEGNPTEVAPSLE